MSKNVYNTEYVVGNADRRFPMVGEEVVIIFEDVTKDEKIVATNIISGTFGKIFDELDKATKEQIENAPEPMRDGKTFPKFNDRYTFIFGSKKYPEWTGKIQINTGEGANPMHPNSRVMKFLLSIKPETVIQDKMRISDILKKGEKFKCRMVSKDWKDGKTLTLIDKESIRPLGYDDLSQVELEVLGFVKNNFNGKTREELSKYITIENNVLPIDKDNFVKVYKELKENGYIRIDAEDRIRVE